MPHAKETSAVNKPAIVFARNTTRGLWSVRWKILIYFHDCCNWRTKSNAHWNFSEIVKLLLKEGFIDRLKASETPEDVYKTIDDYAEESRPMAQ